MKRIIPLLLVMLGCATLKAAPVSLEEARFLTRQFVQANFRLASQSDELSLVYSKPSFYVFNIGENGFVILSSDDSYSPIIGYSDEGVFNPDDMAPALQEYLDSIDAYRTSRVAVATVGAANDWQCLRESGRLVSRHGGKVATYLVATKWNQNYPYNYCCPADPAGPGGHVYAGCVATAAAQLMKYWDHPLQGTGSHTYTPTDNPQYGPITVNFGEATYDWENMPNSISSASPVEQLEAVGTLIYHCGVSVDMNYRPTSSGAVTSQLCSSMPQYFYYTNQMVNIYREYYTHDGYMQLIIDAIDMNWPMVHRGGGHAYVLDGYDDAGLVHFNWGWGGSSDGWFNIDEHNYIETESVIYNYVPAAIYAATPNEPTNLDATVAANNELSVTLTWNNPALTLTNTPLTTIDQVVLMRGNKVIYVADNPAPGEAMTFVDNTIPCFDSYTYTIYAISDGQRGKSASVDGIGVGPTCSWKFVVSSSDFQGWKGSYLSLRNMVGTEIGQVTVNNSTPTIINIEMPLGPVSVQWVPSAENQNNFTVTINIKDSENNTVYSYSGNVFGLEASVLYQGNNSCGSVIECGTPSNLTAVPDESETYILLQWTGVDDPGYGYLIYRDGTPAQLVTDGSTSYLDDDVALGGHCYEVAVFCEGGVSGLSNEACATAGDGCDAGSDLWFEMQANGKPIINWVAPETEGLSGYYVYRKTNEDGEYTQIKAIAPNKTEYKETRALEDGNWYYYKVVAAYDDIDCISAPFKAKYGDEYFVKIYYSITGVGETASQVSLFPNPTTGWLRVEAPGMQSVTVYNLLGQRVNETQVDGDEVNINLKPFGNGMFMVVVQTSEGRVVRKVSVIE